MRDAGDVIATVGTSIYQEHSAATVHPSQASADACIFCQWRRQVSSCLGGRGATCPRPSFTFSLLFRASHFPASYQSHHLQPGVLLGGVFVGSLCMYHVFANLLARQPVPRSAFFGCLVALHHHTICFFCSYDTRPISSSSYFLDLGPLL